MNSGAVSRRVRAMFRAHLLAAAALVVAFVGAALILAVSAYAT